MLRFKRLAAGMTLAGSGGALLLALWFPTPNPPQPRAPAIGPEPAAAPSPTARASSDTRPAAWSVPRTPAVQPRVAQQLSAELPAIEPAETQEDPEAIRESRRARARAELEQLSHQNPKNFLAIFEIMQSQQRGDPADLAGLERATREYMAARARILERVLARFIDDPEAEHGAELDELTRVQAEYRRELEWFARRVPDVENFDAILTTTSLKLPSFLEPPEADRPGERRSLALGPTPREFDPMIKPHDPSQTKGEPTP